jgi:hypothetical protein
LGLVCSGGEGFKPGNAKDELPAAAGCGEGKAEQRTDEPRTLRRCRIDHLMGFSVSRAYGLPDVMACSTLWACESSGLSQHRHLKPTSP